MFGFGKKKNGSGSALVAAASGTVINVDTLPDEVFSKKILGDGYAVKPMNGTIVSPTDGKIIDVQDSHHAYGIQTNDGLELLVHIGIDTVSLNGEGFTPCVKNGDKVKAGQTLCEVDLGKIQAAGYPTDTVVLITNIDEVKSFNVTIGEATAGETEVLTYTK